MNNYQDFCSVLEVGRKAAEKYVKKLIITEGLLDIAKGSYPKAKAELDIFTGKLNLNKKEVLHEEITSNININDIDRM